MHSKTELIRLYRKETNLKVKERILLVIKVEYDNVIPGYAADELHRSRPWELYWLKRYRGEGIEGLKDRPKSGRPPDIPEQKVYEIKNELVSNKKAWTTRKVEDLIIRKSGGTRYYYTHIYRLMHKWGVKQKVTRKVHVNTASKEEGFTVVSTDESFFFYDSLVRKVWIDKYERPVVRITGSHRVSFVWCYQFRRKTNFQAV